MHVGPEGEVSEGGGPGVSQAAGEDGRAGGRGEVLDGAVPHARVDRDHAHVALDNTSSTLGHSYSSSKVHEYFTIVSFDHCVY